MWHQRTWPQKFADCGLQADRSEHNIEISKLNVRVGELLSEAICAEVRGPGNCQVSTMKCVEIAVIRQSRPLYYPKGADFVRSGS